MTAWSVLRESLDSMPDLEGAACVDSWWLFDRVTESETDRRRREIQAIAVCHTCPVLEPCRKWRDTQTFRREDFAAFTVLAGDRITDLGAPVVCGCGAAMKRRHADGRLWCPECVNRKRRGENGR